MTKLVRVLPVLLSLAACDVVYRSDDQLEQQPPAASPVASAPARPGAVPLPPPAPQNAETSNQPILVDSIPGTVLVAPGDVLSKLARAHNIPVKAVIDANKLEPPFQLEVGQVLVIPSVRRYIVQPGDTVPLVARRYDVDVDTIARLNHIQPHDMLKVGLPLILPPVAEKRPVVAAIRPPPPASSPPPPPAPASNPSAAAPAPPPEKLGATALPAEPAEPPKSPPVVAAPPAPPPPAPPPPAPPPPAPVAAAAPPPPQKPAPSVPPQSAATDAAEPPLAPEQQTAAIAAAVSNHRPPVAPLFTWPVRGKVISTFGALPNGAHNDGVNIAAPEGTEVDAADAGTVVYAGNALRGFGNLLLIKHADGWVTAYGHNAELLVKVGDHVRRGQPIAKVGSTGRVSGPQLHFEVRRGTDQGNKAFDPLDHLPAVSGD